jgi:hypothetical protein
MRRLGWQQRRSRPPAALACRPAVLHTAHRLVKAARASQLARCPTWLCSACTSISSRSRSSRELFSSSVSSLQRVGGGGGEGDCKHPRIAPKDPRLKQQAGLERCGAA